MLTPWIIAGATSVGKSALGLQLAEAVNGEIVGADAFQVYQGMPILSACPSSQQLASVRHHLVGRVPLQEDYDVAQYLRAARAAIAEIQQRGRRAIIVGGTGLYLRALLRGLADLPPADEALRGELASLPLEALQAEFLRLDPIGAGQIDLRNGRRLIRAVEVCRLTGRPFSSFRQEWQSEARHEFRGVCLVRPREELYGRINKRVEWMFEEGVCEEVEELVNLSKTAGQVLGLRPIREHLEGRLSRAECITQIQQATRHYAKRQVTWFAREPLLKAKTLGSTDDLHQVLSALEN